MELIRTALEGVVIIEPKVYGDQRGWFCETFLQSWFSENVLDVEFVQDNESFSSYGVVRGLHYQKPPYTQGKLVRVTEGQVLDVAVDVREGSPTFGQHVAVELSADNHRQLFIPRGFAHGFAVLSPTAKFAYKCDNPYAPQSEAGVAFDDPAIGIDWGIEASRMKVSDKDRLLPGLADAVLFDYNEKLY